MDFIIKFLKGIIPGKILNPLLPIYHKILAYTAAFWYGRPSEKMIVIGVTGTKGKSTTTELIARVLEKIRGNVGFTSTVKFKVADKEWLNDKKMTMLGRFKLQKLLHQMVKAGCKYAVIETSSEGVNQYRHKGINYDYLVFTNLTPEHIESHGSFEKYKQAKLRLFKHLTQCKTKKIDNKFIDKVILVNADNRYAEEFLNVKADKKIIYSVLEKSKLENQPNFFYKATDIGFDKKGVYFSLKGIDFKLNLLGLFNIYNAMPAIIIVENEGLPLEKIKEVMEEIKGIEGRMEFIDKGQPFNILIDYAYELESMKQLYETIKLLRGENFFIANIIHILGSCGGGRDKAKRPILGSIAGKKADYVIVTNEDPYDEEPMKIINEVARGAIDAGKEKNKNLFTISDRRQAIKKALSLAQKDDLILITGKGAEQAICIANEKKIPWDDRKVVKELLAVN